MNTIIRLKHRTDSHLLTIFEIKLHFKTFYLGKYITIKKISVSLLHNIFSENKYTERKKIPKT